MERLVEALDVGPADAPPATEPELQLRHQRRVRVLPAVEVAELVARYQAGVSMAELARQHNLHRSAVRLQLERAGVTLRRGSSFPPELLPEAIRLYESGLSTARVGERLGLTQRVVWRALKDVGVPLRDRSGR